MPARWVGSWRGLSGRSPFLVAVLLALVSVACEESSNPIVYLSAPTLTPQGVAYDPGMIHIHELSIDERSGSLYIAAHTGLYRVPEGGSPERVAGIMDLLGFTILEPGVFLASGHPSPAMIREQKLPPELGLIRSINGGRAWQSVALMGEADFHVLLPVNDGIYGYNAFERQLMFSTDLTTWEQRSRLDLYDLVADPLNSQSLMAATPQGIAVSENGGEQWQMQPGAPAILVLVWDEAIGLIGITRFGEVVVMESEAGWETVFQFPAAAEALSVDNGVLLAAIRGEGIWQSADIGRTWEQLLPAEPPPLPR